MISRPIGLVVGAVIGFTLSVSGGQPRPEPAGVHQYNPRSHPETLLPSTSAFSVITENVQAAAAPGPPQRFVSGFILVNVTDGGGRPVLDLDPDDFVVHQGGLLRDVLSARVADYPIAVVVDNTAGPNRDFDAIRRATIRFIGRLGRRPIAIAAANPPRMVATFDDDRAVVVQRVDKLRRGKSSDGLFQTVVVAAQTSRATGAAFSAVVAIIANPGGSFPSDALAAVLDSGTHVHVVVQQRPLAGPSQGRQQSLETLASLADDTGGQFIAIFSPDSFQIALDRLGNQLAGQLMVEYLVPAGSPGGGKVELGVRRSGVKVYHASER